MQNNCYSGFVSVFTPANIHRCGGKKLRKMTLYHRNQVWTMNDGSNKGQVTRRLFLRCVPFAFTVFAKETRALTGIQIHSDFSELVSKIPGTGKPDIYFPDYFLGNWRLIRVLYDVEALPGFESVISPKHAVLSTHGIERLRNVVGRRQEYGLKFINYRGHVVEDRLYNARAEIGTLANTQEPLDATWNPNNPNILSAEWGGSGSNSSGRCVREVKVTKRSFAENPQGVGTFATSEYARVADLVGEGALIAFGRPPSVYGRRRMARYRVRYSANSTNSSLEPIGIDRVVVEYLYPPTVALEEAVLVLKYRDFLKRK